MTLTPIRCPDCGKLANGTLETIPALALLLITDEDTGEADYAGETEICWNDQTTHRGSDGRCFLACHNGHTWPATMQDDMHDAGDPAPSEQTSPIAETPVVVEVAKEG